MVSSIFYNLGEFLRAGVDRALVIEDHTGNIAARNVSGYTCRELYAQIHLILPDELWEASVRFIKPNFQLSCDGCKMVSRIFQLRFKKYITNLYSNSPVYDSSVWMKKISTIVLSAWRMWIRPIQVISS